MTARASHSPRAAAWGARAASIGLLAVLAGASMAPVASLRAQETQSVQSVFVAGTAPGQRPQGAPTLTQFEKPDGWYSRSLTGLQRPYPPSFRFLEDQQGWFTPFNHPGMTGPYDIRGGHAN